MCLEAFWKFLYVFKYFSCVCLHLFYCFGMFLGGFGSIFGRCLGNMLGHGWEVFESILKGFYIVLGKVFRGYKTYKKPIKNLCKSI